MAIAEITRAETAARAGLLRVQSYDVDLDLTGGDERFRSVSVIRFGCTEAGAVTYVDLVAETVHEITLNGAPIDPATAWADGRVALAGLELSNELRVVADFRYGTSGFGLQRSVDSADERVYTFTQLEAAHARRVFANFEQPDLKAEFTFHVTVPRHWTVLSNQPAPEPQPAGDGAAVWHFPPTPRISTYLTAIAAGEYHVVRDSHTTPDGQVVPMAVACRQSMAPYLEADDVLLITRQGLDYFTSLFAGPFPFAKLDQVFVPDNVGAMENVGCIITSESLLFRSRVTETMYEIRAEVILHEMAHQWFGDLVTMKWWEDLWLNESFAELAGFLAEAEATRFTQAWTTFCGGRKIWGYGQDELPSTHPIAARVGTLSEAEANFDGISYAKGAAVLKQLVAYVGRDNFLAGVRSYFDQHAWGNATLDDLLAALSAHTNRNLAEWSKAWLETAGPNTLRSEFALGADGRFTAFAVLQEAPAEHPTLRPHHIAIGLYNLTDDGQLVRTYRVESDVAGPRTDVPAMTGQPQPDLILLNDDDLGYAIIRFDQRSLDTLKTSMGAFVDSLARTVCWGAVADMAAQAELSVPAFVQIVAAGMGSERSVPVIQVMHGHVSRLLKTTADPRWVPMGKELLASRAIELLRAAEPGGDRQLAWAQLLAWTAVAPDQLDLVADLLNGRAKISGLDVDAELRWAFLRRLAATGRAGDAEIDAELAGDRTDAGRRSALAARASIPDAAHKAEAWRQVAESELSLEEAAAVARAFSAAEHADLLAPFAECYFEQLPAIFAKQADMVKMMLGESLFPYTAAGPWLLSRIEEFLGQPDLDPSVMRAVIEGRDVVEKALRSRPLPN